jgi:hypothetical protein
MQEVELLEDHAVGHNMFGDSHSRLAEDRLGREELRLVSCNGRCLS